MTEASDSVGRAREHYDRAASDRFYHRVWAEDDLAIGVGIFREPGDSLQTACRRTVETMMDRLPRPAAEPLSILDLGGGYGAADRLLVRTIRCHVVAVNLSTQQNDSHRQRNRQAGLDDRIRVVDGDFHRLPAGLGRFDVVWSQDSFIHASDRAGLFGEVDRVLKPGGTLIFTDLLCNPACPPDALRPVRDRFGIAGIASADDYRRLAQARGWQVVAAVDLSPNVATHYRCLLATLEDRRPVLMDAFLPEELDRIADGIRAWVAAADRDHLRWGLFHMRKPA